MLDFPYQLPEQRLRRPQDVLHATNLSVEQKRGLLADWASDMRAVADAPAWRRLDDGTLVDIDEITAALARLDDMTTHFRPRDAARPAAKRARHRPWWTRRRDDDDDDPPLVPAGGWLPRPSNQPDAVAAAVAA